MYPVAICLYIDGLDEFDGRYVSIIELINSLKDQSYIKICLSSRPLHEFEIAFAAKPQLKLQDLTFSSIQTYAESRLLKDLEKQNFYQADDQHKIRSLTEQIVRRSEGVFLWAVLAVRNLSQGIYDLADLSDLERQIDELPLGINNLYKQILQRIKPVYRRNAMRYLQLVLFALETDDYILSLHEMYFIANETVKEDAPLTVYKNSIDEFIKACRGFKTRILSHTMGLLDLKPFSQGYIPQFGPSYHVKFFHQTVVEFLSSDEAGNLTMTNENVTENSLRLSYCRGLITYMLYIHEHGTNIQSSQKHPKEMSGRMDDSRFYNLVPAMRQLSVVERVTNAAQSKFINSLSSHMYTNEQYLTVIKAILLFPYDWSKRLPHLPLDLIGVAASFGVSYYVFECIERSFSDTSSCNRCQQHLKVGAGCVGHGSRVFSWDLGEDVENPDQHHRTWLNKRLKWDVPSPAKGHLALGMADDILPETYLLLCCTMTLHFWDGEKADNYFATMRSLLCAGADPMLEMKCVDLPSSTEDCRPAIHVKSGQARVCFWGYWLLFMLRHWCLQRQIVDEVLQGFDPQYLLLTKSLLAHGASLNHPIRETSTWLWYHPEKQEWEFEIEMSAFDILGLIYRDHPDWQGFVANMGIKDHKPKRSIICIYPDVGKKMREDEKACPNREQSEILWPSIYKILGERHTYKIGECAEQLERVFRAQKPHVKLRGDEGYESESEDE